LPIMAMAVVIVLVALGAVAWMYGKKEAPAMPAVSPTPLTVASLEENLSAYRGQVVILNIWATWCGPCIKEIPDFIKLREKYGPQGFEIIGVSIDPIAQQGGGAPAVAPFMKRLSINYPVWMVTDQAALGQYPMGTGIPTTYIIDRNGRVAQKYIGARPMSVFENDIKPLL
jgi:cytochrome c biogenesis protein CcmG, thiol:disulfide interchange protein DsbE